MISRRSVRLKVAQVLYSAKIQQNTQVDSIMNQFNKSIDKAIELNLVALQYLLETMRYAKIHHKREQTKINEDKKQVVSLEILQTNLIQFLEQNDEYNKQIRKYKTEKRILEDLARKMYFKAILLPEYAAFCSQPSELLAFNFYKKYFTKVLFSNQEIIESLEDEFENIEEDFDLIHFALKRSLKRNLENEEFRLSLGHYEWKKEGDFALDLIKVYLANSKDYDKIITPKLKGWELDRIPSIQSILIKMALAEFLQFPSIPTKVTLNEYVDLAKIFCDSKGKIFVNGILDSLQRELTHSGQIVKSGRGLE